MAIRDPIESRRFVASTPPDTNDPPRFGQALETTKDAFVAACQGFFGGASRAWRAEEVPSVRKYGVGFGPGEDPYATTQRIISDWADANEQLPHLAVTAVSGANNRLTIGTPYIGPVQLSPELTTSVGPFTLGRPAFASWSLDVLTVVAGTAYVEVTTPGGTERVEVTLAGTETPVEVAASMREALRSVEPFLRVTRDGTQLTLTASELNVDVDVTASGLTATELVPAGAVDYDVLELITDYGTDLILFDPTGTTSWTAENVAARINRASWVRAEVTEAGEVKILAGGRHGGLTTPNSLEVGPQTTTNALTVLGLGQRGTCSGGDAITGYAPKPLLLSTTGIGLAVTAATSGGVTAQVTLSGLAEGTYDVTSVDSDDAVYISAPWLGPELLDGATWFVAARDASTNTARPVMNRFHESERMTVTLSVLADSPNTRDELCDSVVNYFTHQLELQYYTLLGRGVIQPSTYPDEMWLISVAQDVAVAGASTVNRPGDAKHLIHEARITVPATLFMYVDRAATTPDGQPWALTLTHNPT